MRFFRVTLAVFGLAVIASPAIVQVTDTVAAPNKPAVVDPMATS